MNSEKWGIREALPEDMAFICDSWLESFRKSHARGPIPRSLYRTVYREVIQYYLDRDMTTLVAFNPEDASQIFGWACVEHPENRSPCLHYVFVKAPFRRWGIATALLKASGVDPKTQTFVYTFKTPASTSKLNSWRGRFDPFYSLEERDQRGSNEDPERYVPRR